MKERYPGHQTQWAAQFAVASELCKRRYRVALTLGNHPAVDLMVQSPGGTQFSVDVKGLHERNFWPVKAKRPQDHLYYVFAFVPWQINSKPAQNENRFYVIPQGEVNAALKKKNEADRKRALAKGKSAESADKFPCLPFELGKQWENKWEVLPV